MFCLHLFFYLLVPPDHDGAEHEAEADHGVQGLGEGRGPGGAQHVQHQRVARVVQAADEETRHHYR